MSEEVSTPEKNNGKEVCLKILKRALDIFSGVVLFIVTSWLILICALVKFCEDFHNPFYAGVRISKKGKEYKHFKIRTMCIHAEELEAQLIEAGLNEAEEIPFRMTNDPRITPVGKFLRRYYLDRFPAFLNVIAGQITIVDIFKKREQVL
ncbi:MAG: sugar transferase [Clostridia bacterium]|nr:sugar transferase [Clostridia bacterium]